MDGPSIDNPGPMILDTEGELVWTSDHFGHAANLKVQWYRGQDYLTFWAGEKLQESGQGVYYMLDSSYRTVFTVSAVGDDLYGDLHEFEITDEDTALITVYNRTQVDLTNTDMAWVEDGLIVDGIIQEIDIASGKLVFQWRASDHLDDLLFAVSFGDYVDNGPFDYFHINSVDKDSRGNYLVSIRHLHMIVYIDGHTGEVLWALGGHANDFKDISGGAATNFQWQHDARWISEEQGVISLFDNGIARHHSSDAEQSEGRMIRLDFANRTAEHIHSFTSLQRVSSTSQGSVQVLPAAEKSGDAHVFVGWGSSAAYSEFTSDGKLLCETHFAPSSLFYFERAKSYRAIKAPALWKAEPEWSPSAAIESDLVYVSWNGATEVAWWVLQGALVSGDVQTETYEEVDILAKDGFECSFELPSPAQTYTSYRVAALDAEMNMLRYSNVVESPPDRTEPYVWAVVLSASTAALVILLLVAYPGVVRQALAHGTFVRDRAGYRRLNATPAAG
ncbi:hypothetical protein LTR36_007771 [Oleoguttula mirabilis]|uniref:Arylsulfotransferase n=1 Tax=Oleoguttula mirabilis TaxID=1507867 RepID=A0AAV9JA31_9PEZI|nr:hypothetical protein LTR36_007771 [Oleoguttula mirabilis]